MKRARLILCIVLLLIGAGLGVFVEVSGRPRRVAQPSLDSPLAPYVLLEEGAAREFELTIDGYTVPWWRRVVGWEELHGVPHAHVEIGAGAHLIMSEWLRPAVGANGAPQIVCARRRVQGEVLSIRPPLPILQGPLRKDAAWTWSGRVGEYACEGSFKVLDVAGEVVTIEQVMTVGTIRSRRVTTYAPGRGMLSQTSQEPGVLDEQNFTVKLKEPE